MDEIKKLQKKRAKIDEEIREATMYEEVRKGFREFGKMVEIASEELGIDKKEAMPIVLGLMGVATKR